MAKHQSYFEHSSSDPLQCPQCGWSGTAGDAANEMYRELMDFSCPSCDTMLLIVPYPTIDEMRRYAAAGNEKAKRELAEFERLADEAAKREQ